MNIIRCNNIYNYQDKQYWTKNPEKCDIFTTIIVRLAWQKNTYICAIRMVYYTIMIISSNTTQYFRMIASKVTAAMAVHHASTPYYIEDDPIIRNYECIRDVWYHHLPIVKACSKYQIARSSYYELEHRFITYGMAGLFFGVNSFQQQTELEELAMLVKKCKPNISHTAVLRIAEALPLTQKQANPEMISKILASYGYGQSNLKNDREFWGRIQRSLAELNRLVANPINGRDKKYRKESFFIDADLYHKRLDCLRELFFHPAANIQPTCVQYDIAMTSYYRLVRDYRLYGPWSIIPSSAPGKNKNISPGLQLKIIVEKLKHPTLSSQQLVDKYKLRCSRYIVNRVIKRWHLTDNKLRPIALDQYIDLADTEPAVKPLTTAYETVAESLLLQTRRINRHFELICKKMRSHAYHICDPGPFILAPFVNDLGIVQSFETYGPPRLRGKEITNLALLNIFRILSGYRGINHLSNNKDRAVALASGIGFFGSSSRFYEDTIQFKFDQLYQLKLDLVARAKQLAIIEGLKIGFDFHLKEFYGMHAAENNIGNGPTKSGDLAPAFRPHIAWDLASNVIIFIAYYQGAVRSTTIIRQFCEQNIFPIFDRRAIQEIYMDSEYTKEGDYHYFKQVQWQNGEIYVCLKQNKQIKKIIEPALNDPSNWFPNPDNRDDEYNVIRTILPKTKLPLMITILREIKKKNNIRCFGTTNMKLTAEDLLRKYRYRWNTENGIKDLVQSYFFDEIYGKDPDKIDFEFYCVMVARLAYEHFLKTLNGEWYHKQDGNKYTLDTMRTLLFEKLNCTLEQDATGDLMITLLDMKPNKLTTQLEKMFDDLRQAGKNKVLWWNNRGIRIRTDCQF